MKEYDKRMATAVRKGLSSKPKSLPSWLFYDAIGDELFRQIMRTPEYYPTRCEFDILQEHKEDLLKHLIHNRKKPFKLIEFGAGDGLKTEILLRHFQERQAPFTYVPVDISANVLGQLSERLAIDIPELKVEPLNQSYERALATLPESQERKMILFMGANIGNFSTVHATGFLKNLVRGMSEEDLLLIGFDLKKDPRIILEAYDDPRGLTARFNLNLLERLNRELGAAFAIEHFTHFPYYDPAYGTMKSFLVSRCEQAIHIGGLNNTFHFAAWEAIHTEISQKYDEEMINKLVALSGLRVVETYFDKANYFCDVLTRAR